MLDRAIGVVALLAVSDARILGAQWCAVDVWTCGRVVLFRSWLGGKTPVEYAPFGSETRVWTTGAACSRRSQIRGFTDSQPRREKTVYPSALIGLVAQSKPAPSVWRSCRMQTRARAVLPTAVPSDGLPL